MEGFQKTVLIVAIIVLMIILVFIGMTMSKAKSNQQWPPMTAQCPDYFSVDVSGNCENKLNLGTCNNTQYDGTAGYKNFNESPYIGSNELCAKSTWAKDCGLSWDGITYGVKDPCQT